jgi:hypothetical protein
MSEVVEVEEAVIQNQNSPANLNLLIDHDTNMSDQHYPDVQDDIPCDGIIKNFAKFMMN